MGLPAVRLLMYSYPPLLIISLFFPSLSSCPSVLFDFSQDWGGFVFSQNTTPLLSALLDMKQKIL